MTIPLSLATRQARLLAVRDLIDAGGGGSMDAYPNSPPAYPETATAEVLIASIPLAPTSGSIGASGMVATFTITVPRAANAVSTAIVGWVRVRDNAGTGIMDLLAGAIGSGQPAIFSDTQVYVGGEVQLVSCVMSE